MPSREERGALTPTLADLGTGEQTPCSFLGEELEIKPKTNKPGLLVQALHLWQQRVRGERSGTRHDVAPRQRKF